MEKKFKGLVAIQDVLDDRYQKLSDKYLNLKLSHNRKKKALFEIRRVLYNLVQTYEYCGSLFMPCYAISDLEVQQCLMKIDDALFSDGRIMERKCTMQKKDSKSCLKESKKKKQNSNK